MYCFLTQGIMSEYNMSPEAALYAVYINSGDINATHHYIETGQPQKGMLNSLFPSFFTHDPCLFFLVVLEEFKAGTTSRRPNYICIEKLNKSRHVSPKEKCEYHD